MSCHAKHDFLNKAAHTAKTFPCHFCFILVAVKIIVRVNFVYAQKKRKIVILSMIIILTSSFVTLQPHRLKSSRFIQAVPPANNKCFHSLQEDIFLHLRQTTSRSCLFTAHTSISHRFPLLDQNVSVAVSQIFQRFFHRLCFTDTHQQAC